MAPILVFSGDLPVVKVWGLEHLLHLSKELLLPLEGVIAPIEAAEGPAILREKTYSSERPQIGVFGLAHGLEQRPPASMIRGKNALLALKACLPA